MTVPKHPPDNYPWTNRAHTYAKPTTAALKGGRWVRRGLIWIYEYRGKGARA